MADTTILAIQNSKHVDWISINLFDEYLIVTIFAIQRPKIMITSAALTISARDAGENDLVIIKKHSS